MSKWVRMEALKYLGKGLPFVLRLFWKGPPVLPDDLGDLRVREAGMLGNHGGLVMLTVQDER